MTDFESWCDELNQALDTLQNPTARLTPPPVGGDPRERLVALSLLRSRLGVHDGNKIPAKEAAEGLASHWTSSYRRSDLEDALFSLCTAVDGGIVSALEQLPPEHRAGDLIRIADFGELRFLSGPLSEPSTFTGQPQPITVVAGAVDSLALGHWCRSIIPRDDYYMLDRTEQSPPTAAIVLGRVDLLMNGGQRPRPFVCASDAVNWTKIYRSRQRDEEAAAEDQRRREARRQRDEFWSSELGKRLKAERELQRYKERHGEFPPEPPKPPPTILVGGR
jgi:hypothetical protein